MATLEQVYWAHAGIGQRGIDCRGFVTLCRTSGLLDETFTDSHAEAVFTNSMIVSRRRLDAPRLKEAVRQVALARGLEEASICQMLSDSQRLRRSMPLHGSLPALPARRAAEGALASKDRSRRRSSKSTARRERKRDGPLEGRVSPGTALPAAQGAESQPGGMAHTLPSAAANTLFLRRTQTQLTLGAELKCGEETPCLTPANSAGAGAACKEDVCGMPSPAFSEASTLLPSQPSSPSDTSGSTTPTSCQQLPSPPSSSQASEGGSPRAQDHEGEQLQAWLPVGALGPPGDRNGQGEDSEVCLVEKWEDDPCSPCSPRSVGSDESEELALPLPADGPEEESPVRERPAQRSASCPRLLPSSNPSCHIMMAKPPPPPAPPASPAQPGRRRPMPTRSASRGAVSLQAALGCARAIGSTAEGDRPSSQPSSEACTIRDTFDLFCAGQTHMDGKAFVRLCKRCQLIDQAFSLQDARLLFSSAVPASQVRMAFRDFEKALAQIASRRGIKREAIAQAVAFWEAPLPEALARPRQAERRGTPAPPPRADDVEELEVLSPSSPLLDAEIEQMRSQALQMARPSTRKLSRASSVPCVGRLRPQHIAQSGQDSAWNPDGGFAERPQQLSFPPMGTL